MAGTHHLHKVGSARRRSVALGCVAIVGAAFVAAIGSMSSRADVPCAASVPDIASALSTAASCGRRVEIASLDAASSTTYADPDGTASTDLSTVPVRVPRAGGWVPVDL